MVHKQLLSDYERGILHKVIAKEELSATEKVALRKVKSRVLKNYTRVSADYLLVRRVFGREIDQLAPE